MSLKITDQILQHIGKAVVAAMEKVAPETGVTVDETYQTLEPKMKRKLGKRHLLHVLSTGMITSYGKPITLENGNYSMDTKITESSSSSPLSDDQFSQEDPNVNGVKIQKSIKKSGKYGTYSISAPPREKSERKRTQKIMFDPSDVEPVKKIIKIKERRESEPTGESSNLLIQCKLCEKELIDKDDAAIVSTCGDCRRKVHRSCLDGAESLKTSDWRCDSCKICLKCHNERTPKWEAWVHCELCGDPFHQKCVNVKRTSGSKWMCNKCKKAFQDDDSQDDKQIIEPKPKAKISRRKSTSKKMNGDGTDDGVQEVPDCSDWTPEQVHSYFLAYLPSHDAKVLLDQEIDGKVLLLLSRSDILTKFNLKLGPALKLYLYVKRLQLRSSDIRHCWS